MSTSKVFRVVELTFLGFMLVVTSIGVYIASQALSSYQKQNRLTEAQSELTNKSNEVSLTSQLDGLEQRIYNLILTHDYLNGFWAYFPNETNQDKLFQKKLIVFCSQAQCAKPGFNIPVKSIEQLESWLYDGDTINDCCKKELRVAYSLSEIILYTVATAHNAYSKGVIGEDIWHTYSPYIEDAGSNPLFLDALYYGHEKGYITTQYAKYLQDRLRANDDTRAMIEYCYSEMLDSNWAGKIDELHNVQANRSNIR